MNTRTEASRVGVEIWYADVHIKENEGGSCTRTREKNTKEVKNGLSEMEDKPEGEQKKRNKLKN